MKKSSSQKANLNRNKNKNIININNNVINLDEKLKLLESENNALNFKSQQNSFLEKQNFYQSENSIKKIKPQKELSYKQILSVNDKRISEDKIKQRYIHNLKENTKRLNYEIDMLNQEIFHKNEMINSLQDKVYSLNEKLNQEKLNCHFIEKECENKIKLEKRKMEELKLILKQITKEATDTIKNLSLQLEEIQMKSKLQNNNIINLNNIRNSFNELFTRLSIDKDMNYNSINQNRYDTNNVSNNYLNKIKKENYLLKYENNKLKNELQHKNEEIKFWKDLKNSISTSDRNDILKEVKIKKLGKKLMNYDSKIKQLRNQYKNIVIKNEIEKNKINHYYLSPSKNNSFKNSYYKQNHNTIYDKDNNLNELNMDCEYDLNDDKIINGINTRKYDVLRRNGGEEDFLKDTNTELQSFNE
jgi:hypothetical protein